jgi:hypothetical protein
VLSTSIETDFHSLHLDCPPCIAYTHRPSSRLSLPPFHCQGSALSLTLWIAWRLVKQLDSNLARVNFLAQSYASLLIIFAGAYFAIFLLSDRTAFHLTRVAPAHATVFEFVYFAATIASTAGFGDIVPIAAASRLAVTVHVLASYFFSSIVLGLGAFGDPLNTEISRDSTPLPP